MINYDKNLLQFINSQKLLTISTFDTEPWICNVYFAFGEAMKRFIFVSSPEAKHSTHIGNNPRIAFSTAWFNPENLASRKSIQAKGKCYSHNPGASKPEDEMLEQYISAYQNKFPSAKQWLNFEYLTTSETSRLYTIEAEYIKFWNDELFGEEKTLEYFA